MNTESRTCQNCTQTFVIEPDDFAFYEKMKVPSPHVCPDCRFKMRAMWRNETTLYSGRKCGMCGKSVISIYNPKSPYTVYCYDCFCSDKWDARDYSIDYASNRPFFDQIKELLEKVPKNCLGISSGDGQNINSEYVNMASGCKDCYLVFNTSPAEELLYSRGVKNGKNSSDIYFGVDFENCYECINVQKSSGVIWGKNISGCVDCMFISNGSGLTNCFCCVNLRNKSYCWFNEQLTHEEYSKRITEVLGSHEAFENAKKRFEEFCLKFPNRENNNLKTIDSTGDYLTECKSVKDSFEATRAENSRYLFSSKVIKDSLGTTGYGTNSENLLEVVATGYSSNIIGSFWAENCQDVMYSFDPRHCHDCIGCDALKNGKYSILNKEYSKEEYEKIRDNIVKELNEKDLHGLMMPISIAPFAYNETIAQDNFPMTKEQAIEKGYRWRDSETKNYIPTMNSGTTPNDINEVNDSITKEIIECAHKGECNQGCTKAFRIIPDELAFYKKIGVPLPTLCPACRTLERLRLRLGVELYDQSCMCAGASSKNGVYKNAVAHNHGDSQCENKFKTGFKPEKGDLVYCEQCYQQEVE